MGTYLNPGNEGFERILNKKYIDKTGVIELLNNTINTPDMLTCVSRPRRFGKSYTAQVLCAYYDKTCDSDHLFRNLKIQDLSSYREHLNKYDVIYLDMANILEKTNSSGFIDFIKENISNEIIETYPEVVKGTSIDSTLINAAGTIGNKFIMIIDEWDIPIREAPDIEKDYLKFLRMLFKGSGTTARIFSAVYMTGILPVKKDGSQSALSDFKEYTMLKPGIFAEYTGFTEKEVIELCRKQEIDFNEMKRWYDGYVLKGAGDIYNPNSVMEAIRNKEFDSYWVQTSAIDSLMKYIGLDYMGLSKTIAELIGGTSVDVDPLGFSNDLVTFRNKDDVLTLLIHLGYLAYDSESKTAYIPNEEIRREFEKAVRVSEHEETMRRVAESDKLIEDTVHMDAEAVARQIEKVHTEETSPLFYNNEQALRSVVKLAYFAYRDYYLEFQEIPSGTGIADVVYFPKKKTDLPALLIELKWDKTAVGAIQQIKDKNYPDIIKDYGGEILLVGINYDKAAPPGERHYTCVIERVGK